MTTAPVGGSVRTSFGEPVWRAAVVVTPKEGVNDPEGETILGGLRGLGYVGVRQVRAGRYFEVSVIAPSAGAATAAVAEMCDRLLANPVIETYRIEGVEEAMPVERRT